MGGPSPPVLWQDESPPRPPVWVVYVDLDAYYVSCELRDRPELVGREVIVGPPPHDGPSRGVVLSASYPARQHGVHSAMPAAQAARLAPDAVWIPPDFSKYVRVSHQVRAVLGRFSPDVVPYSIDEAAVYLEGATAESARSTAERIQAALRDELGLPSSLGLATGRTVAKIATDRAKPGGIVLVPPEEVARFLAPLPIRVIPGVGPKTEVLLGELGFRTIGELVDRPSKELERRFGSFGHWLLSLARGEYTDPVETDRGPRARSADRTLPSDATEWEQVAPIVGALAEEAAASVEQEGQRYGGVSVAFRWADFHRTQRGRALAGSGDDAATARRAALRLAEELWSRTPAPRAVRTVSVRLDRLVPRSHRQSTLESWGLADD